ncbi:MAG TPA: DegV family protein [Anaerolineales bacterium]|nr:DegV family protein [Anaerolineales bacterium]
MRLKLAVLTDSTASIPENLLEELHIHTVAYYIHRGKEVLRDLVTIQREEFLRWLATASVLPTTASPGPGDYVEAYKRLAEAGAEEIISIHMTSKASGAYQAACIAQSMLEEELPELRVEVIDTRNAALCQGWMAIEAARAALAGSRLEKAVAKVRAMIPVTHLLQTADTLRYLYMGGRIGRARNLVGSLLNIKPLIGVEDGEIVPLGIARSRMQAYQAMVDKIEAVVGKSKIKVAYVHAGAKQEVEKIKNMVEGRLNAVESIIGELSPALAVHTGPGTAGLCYFPADVRE